MVASKPERALSQPTLNACFRTVACLLIGLWPVFASWPPVLERLAETISAHFGAPRSDSYNALLVALPAIDAALFLAALHRWEEGSWPGIGLRRPAPGELLVTAAASSVYLKLIVALLLACGRLRLSGAAAPPSATALEWSRVGILVLVTASGALWEEVVFRGYLISKVQRLSGSRLMGACVSLAASVAAHVPHWGLSPALWKVPLALFFIVLYLLRENVALCWVAHIVTDLDAAFFYGGASAFLRGG